jgi:hypothetical protein
VSSSKSDSEYGLMTVEDVDFQRSFDDSIDEALTDLFSDEVRTAFYTYLEKGFSIPREEIPVRINDLESAMEKTFGLSSRTIGKVIARKLYKKLGLAFGENSGDGFEEYVLAARTKRDARVKPLSS